MISYTVVPIDSIVELEVTGELDLDASFILLLDVVRRADLAGHDLLIDLRKAQSDLSFKDVYRLVQFLDQHPDAFSGRLALLDDYDDGFLKTQFLEASARDHGFEVRAFLKEAAAIAWLEGEPAPKHP